MLTKSQFQDALITGIQQELDTLYSAYVANQTTNPLADVPLRTPDMPAFSDPLTDAQVKQQTDLLASDNSKEQLALAFVSYAVKLLPLLAAGGI